MDTNQEACLQNTIVLDKKKAGIKSGGNWFSLIMLLPVIFHFLILYCGVNLSSIMLAFTTNTPDGGQVFSLVNFEYFLKELAKTDSAIYMAIFNTLQYYLLGLAKFILTSFVAYFFYKKVYLHKIYKIIFFLPSMVPGMVYISIFKNLSQLTDHFIWLLRH